MIKVVAWTIVAAFCATVLAGIVNMMITFPFVASVILCMVVAFGALWWAVEELR